MEPHLEWAGTAVEEAPVRNRYCYLNHRLDGLDYPRALALSLPTGSGMIESGHRHVLHVTDPNKPALLGCPIMRIKSLNSVSSESTNNGLPCGTNLHPLFITPGQSEYLHTGHKMVDVAYDREPALNELYAR